MSRLASATACQSISAGLQPAQAALVLALRQSSTSSGKSIGLFSGGPPLCPMPETVDEIRLCPQYIALVHRLCPQYMRAVSRVSGYVLGGSVASAFPVDVQLGSGCCLDSPADVTLALVHRLCPVLFKLHSGRHLCTVCTAVFF
jgi:hypothetical protein